MREREAKEMELYALQGFNIIESLFTRQEVRVMDDETQKLMQQNIAGKVLEEDGETVRSVNGPDLHSTLFQNLACDDRLLKRAEALLGGPVYVHQYKINTKQLARRNGARVHYVLQPLSRWSKNEFHEREEEMGKIIHERII